MADMKLRRNTKQRQVILEELRKLTNHPTAAQLFEIARRRLPKISLATVYRNLDLLVGMGVVRKLDTAGGEARFDGDLDCHHHVRCVDCGRVDDLHGVEFELPDDKFTSPRGYDIIGHRIEFCGVCPACQAPSEQSGAERTTADGVTGSGFASGS